MSKVTDIISDLKNIEALTGEAQEKLVSGTNIKTVGGNSILGSGDIVISGTPIASNIGTLFRHGGWATTDLINMNNNYITYHQFRIDGNYLYISQNESTSGAGVIYNYKINMTTNLVESYVYFNNQGGAPYYGHAITINDGTNNWIVHTAMLSANRNIHFFKYDLSWNYISQFSHAPLDGGTQLPSGGYPKTIINDSTYFYYAYAFDTTQDTIRICRTRKDGTETKYIELSHATTGLSMGSSVLHHDASSLYVSTVVGGSTQILKINKSTFAVSSQIEVQDYYTILGVDVTYLYIATGSTLTRLNISTLAFVDNFVYSDTIQSITSFIISGFLYIGTARIIRLSDMVSMTLTYNASANYNAYAENYPLAFYTNNRLNIGIIDISKLTFGTSVYSENIMMRAVQTQNIPTTNTTNGLITTSIINISALQSLTTDTTNLISTTKIINPIINKLESVDKL